MVKRKRKKTSLFSKRCLILLAASLLVVVAASIYLQSKKSQADIQTGPLDKISTGLIGEYASLILIAQDQGYFKRNGLDVTITEYAAGPDAIADLLSGKIDTAMASDFAGVRSSFSGEDIKILSNMSRAEAFYLVGRKDRKIMKAADLKGKKIGITQKTVGEFFLGQFLTFNRISRKDTTIVNLTQSELSNALIDGRIDAAVLFEPNAYQTSLRLGANANRLTVQSGQSINSLFYSTGKLTRERPDVIKRYLKSVIEAERFLKNNNKQARTLVANRLKYDESYINYIWPQFDFEVSLNQELLLNMDDQARWAIENKLTTAKKVPNYLRLIYFDGLEAVKPEGITIIR